MTPALVRQQSHERLKRLQIPINEHLPLLEPIDQFRPQSAEAVARRVVILSYIMGIGFGQPGAKLRKPLEEFGLMDDVSADERRLLLAKSYTRQETIDAQWKMENIQAFGWCLGLTELDPLQRSDGSVAAHLPRPFGNPSAFIDGAALRPVSEIMQEADFYYRLHWAARNAELHGEESAIELSVIQERRKALDWTLGVESDWDEMPMDT